MFVNLNLVQLQKIQNQHKAPSKVTFGCKGMHIDDFNQIAQAAASNNTMHQLLDDLDLAKEFRMNVQVAVLRKAVDIKWDESVNAMRQKFAELEKRDIN